MNFLKNSRIAQECICNTKDQDIFFSFSELNKEDGVDVFIPMEPIHFEDLAHDSYRKKLFKSYNRTEQGIYNKKKEPVWLNHLDSL